MNPLMLKTVIEEFLAGLLFGILAVTLVSFTLDLHPGWWQVFTSAGWELILRNLFMKGILWQ
jgi:hypothetical protein